jgi:hypothetical protein
MKSKKLSGALLIAAIIASLCVSPAHSQEPTETGQNQKPKKSMGRFPDDIAGLEAMANQAIEDDNALRLLQTTILLRRQQPYANEHFVNMVRAYAMMERPTSAYNYMLQMQQQGLTYDFDQLDESSVLGGTEVYDYLNDLLIRAGDPAGEAEPAFRIESEYAMPSAIAWDESRQKFLLGTARDGLLLAIDELGEVSELLSANEENGMWSVLDIAVDPQHNRLWIASAALPVFSAFDAGDAQPTALLEFELDNLNLLGRYLVDSSTGPHQLGSIALGPDGAVYIADRQQAVLYRKQPGADVIAPLLADNELSGFRDIAISPSGARIYLADADKGILVADLVNESAVMLEGPDTLNQGGIEGMFHVGDELIIVQSGIQPQRVMALQLDPSGGEVEEVRPMAIALPWFNRPSSGTLRGDSIFYFADAPAPDSDAPASEVTVLRTALNAGANIVAPDKRKFNEDTWGKKDGQP